MNARRTIYSFERRVFKCIFPVFIRIQQENKNTFNMFRKGQEVTNENE